MNKMQKMVDLSYVCPEFQRFYKCENVCSHKFVKKKNPNTVINIDFLTSRTVWKLDLCTTVLPQLDKLLQSKYER